MISSHSCPQFRRFEKIQTPPSRFWVWADKTSTTRWSGGSVQVWVQVQVWVVRVQNWVQSPCRSSGNHSRSYSRRKSKGLTANSMAGLLGPRSGTPWGGRTGKHKHKAFLSPLQLLQAATCLLDENMLPLLRYWLSSRGNEVLMICKFRAVTSHLIFFFIWNEVFDVIGKKLVLTKAVPIASLNFSISHWFVSKNMTQEQNSIFQIISCAKQQI